MNYRAMDSSLAAGIVLLSAAATAQAQQASADTSHASANGQLAEIIVTAEKREQSINDVGLTVAAVTGQQLVSAGITDISELPRLVSGFSASRSNDDVPVFTIRGIGFNAVQISAAPTVSAYVDEAPLPYLAMTGGAMLDLARVEVLKGPQGTLFGNNSTGGSINFIAAKPTPEFSTGFHTTVDRFGQVFFEGFVGGPVTDTFSVRVSANTTQGGDWQHTYTPGPYLKNGSADQGAERIIADWRPNDRLTVSANLNSYYDLSDPQFSQLGLAAPSGGPGSAVVVPPYGSVSTYPLPPHDNRAVDFAANPSTPYGRDDHFYQGVLHVDYEISNALRATSITNYAHLNMSVNFPLDGTRIDIIEGGHSGDIKTYGEELRLSGDFPDQALHTIAGVNYSKDEINEDENYGFNHFSIVPPGFHFNPRGDFTSETEAAFINADWDIARQLTLTTGARYTDVKHTYDGCFADDGDGTTRLFQGGIANEFLGAFGMPPTTAYATAKCLTIGPAPTFLPYEFLAHNTEDNVSWRVGLNYKPIQDLLLYGLVSRGYKAGAYPFLFPIVSAQYSRVAQEELTDYETGMKFSPNRKVSLNSAVFYYDYRNKQIYADQPVPFLGPAQTLLNIPKSDAYGAEFEATVMPIERLTFHAAATYLHTQINDPGPYHLDGFGNTVDFRGKPFDYSPKWSGTFDGEYRIPVAAGLDAVVGIDGNFNSVAYGDSSATDAFKLNAYTVVNARIGIESHHGWSVTGWVHNLANTYYWTSVNFAGDAYERTAGIPLNFGIAASYKY